MIIVLITLNNLIASQANCVETAFPVLFQGTTEIIPFGSGISQHTHGLNFVHQRMGCLTNSPIGFVILCVLSISVLKVGFDRSKTESGVQTNDLQVMQSAYCIARLVPWDNKPIISQLVQRSCTQDMGIFVPQCLTVIKDILSCYIVVFVKRIRQ